jgi:hypothetical protein
MCACSIEERCIPAQWMRISLAMPYPLTDMRREERDRRVMTMEFLMKRPSRERWHHIFTSTCALALMAVLIAACTEPPIPPPPCLTTELPDPTSELGNEVFVGTIESTNLFDSSCSMTNPPERVFTWIAPESGWYSFDTVRSNLDTILSVWTGNLCEGTELACNNDYDPIVQSYVAVRLEAGEAVYLIVEGDGSTTGQFAVNIHELAEQECTDTLDNDNDGLIDCADSDCGCVEVECTDETDNDEDGAVDCDDDDCDCTCPSEDLGSQLGPLVHTGSTVGHPDLAASCGGDGAPDASFVWTAPRAGAFRIDTEGSMFDTVLHVQEGNACGSFEVACDDDADDAPFGTWSEILLVLSAGEAIVITVDGYDGDSGDFVINITDVTELQESSCVDDYDTDADGAVDCDDDDCDCTCPMNDLGTALGEPVFEGSTTLRGNLDSSTCGGSSAPDASFVWTAPQTANYRIHTGGSSFDTVLYVREGDMCGGAERVCDDDETISPQSQVELNLMAGETVVITVDGFSDSAGSFALNIECLACT